jgi:hypothetical protein
MDKQTFLLDIAIDWKPFTQTEKELIETAIQRGDIEHLAAIINEVTPEKADVIASIQAKLRPKAFTFESDTQKEAEIWMQTNPMTPEKEKEWQEKIDTERKTKLEQLGISEENIKSIDTSDQKNVKILVDNDLSKIVGLGDASIKKLIANNVDTVEKFNALTDDQKKEILSPIVAAKFIKNA